MPDRAQQDTSSVRHQMPHTLLQMQKRDMRLALCVLTKHSVGRFWAEEFWVSPAAFLHHDKGRLWWELLKQWNTYVVYINLVTHSDGLERRAWPLDAKAVFQQHWKLVSGSRVVTVGDCVGREVEQGEEKKEKKNPLDCLSASWTAAHVQSQFVMINRDVLSFSPFPSLSLSISIHRPLHSPARLRGQIAPRCVSTDSIFSCPLSTVHNRNL